VTRREYYVNRAAEFLVASEQISSDRNALLHMAATYVQIAIESEYHKPPGSKASVPIEPHQTLKFQSERRFAGSERNKN